MILKLLMVNFLVSLAGMVYLCLVDIYFVFIMNEEISFVNKFPLLVFIMPFVSVYLVNRQIGETLLLSFKVILLISTFIIMSMIALTELLWVSTHFHSMLGGKI